MRSQLAPDAHSLSSMFRSRISLWSKAVHAHALKHASRSVCLCCSESPPTPRHIGPWDLLFFLNAVNLKRPHWDGGAPPLWLINTPLITE